MLLHQTAFHQITNLERFLKMQVFLKCNSSKAIGNTRFILTHQSGITSHNLSILGGGRNVEFHYYDW